MFQPAAWGDDTDMMICIANAMIQDGKINLHTIAKNFQDWVHAPEARGIGQTTYKVLAFADYTEKPQQAAELIWRMSRKEMQLTGRLCALQLSDS